MEEFNYLSVLVSIILGLGITQLLTGIGRMLQNRERVKLYWPTIASVVVLLVAHVLIWWTLFELRVQTEWTFPGFLSVLLMPWAPASCASWRSMARSIETWTRP